MRARRLKTVETVEAPLAPTWGHLVGWERGRGIMIELPDGHVALAQSLVALPEDALQAAVAERRAALLTFEDGDLGRPVILGLLTDIPAAPATAPATGREPVVIKSQESIELRCEGTASTTKSIVAGVTEIDVARSPQQTSNVAAAHNRVRLTRYRSGRIRARMVTLASRLVCIRGPEKVLVVRRRSQPSTNIGFRIGGRVQRSEVFTSFTGDLLHRSRSLAFRWFA